MRDQMWILAELMILAITEYVLLMPVHGQPVWNNPGSKACDTLYPNAQKGYVILKWQFQSSSEPAEINWKFGSTFIMEKYAGSPASGLNGYDVSYITGEEGCGDEKQSGCILLNGTSEADVGTYYIDVTADGTTIFDSGELTFNHDFNEVNASSILNNNCNLQLGDQNYTLAQSEISLSQAMTTVVSLQWDCSAVPAAKKYVTHNGATTPCSDILTTECQTAPIELTDGDLKIIFDYSETWNPEFSIQINTPDSTTTPVQPVTTTTTVTTTTRAPPDQCKIWVYVVIGVGSGEGIVIIIIIIVCCCRAKNKRKPKSNEPHEPVCIQPQYELNVKQYGPSRSQPSGPSYPYQPNSSGTSFQIPRPEYMANSNQRVYNPGDMNTNAHDNPVYDQFVGY